MKIKPITLSICLLFGACASLNSPNPFKSIIWQMKKDMRKPGAEMVVNPERIWRKYRCNNNALPFVQLIRNEVIPQSLAAGDEINHRFIYVMCSEQPTQVLKGTLYRSFFYKGEMIFEHEIENFEISPGQWVIDAFVTIPKQADAGIYSIKISFYAPNPIFEKDITFSVYNKEP